LPPALADANWLGIPTGKTSGSLHFAIGAGMVISILLHELGHLGLARIFGVRGRLRIARIGVLILPVSNVSGAWVLDRGRRVLIAVAGPFVSLALGVTALSLASRFVGSPVAIALASIGIMSTIAGCFSLLPLHRADGYYILSHMVDVPNLEAQASAACSRSRPRAERNWWLGLYGILNWGAYALITVLLLVRVVAGYKLGLRWKIVVPAVGLSIALYYRLRYVYRVAQRAVYA